MPNRPEFMAIWLGIIHAGGAAALLNTNLVGPSLAHCIDTVEPKHLIVAAELLNVFSTIRTVAQVESRGSGCTAAASASASTSYG